jgi:hypothetical protein
MLTGAHNSEDLACCWRATASARLKYASAFFWIWRERLESDYPQRRDAPRPRTIFPSTLEIPLRAFPGAFLTNVQFGPNSRGQNPGTGVENTQ